MSHTLKENNLRCLHVHRPIIDNSDATYVYHEATDHGHCHHHDIGIHRPKQRRALTLCVILTASMMLIEFIAGWFTGSLMLISDAIHMLSHAMALGLSFLAIILAQKKVSERFPFGFYRVEILAALLNGIGIAIFSGWIIYEAIQRIINPIVILSAELTIVAVLGLAVNLTTAFILHKAGAKDLNTKSAYLHMLADTLSSVAIVIGGGIIYFTDWFIIDPILSMVVAGIVAKWSWELLRDSTLIMLERTPDHIEIKEVEKDLKQKFPEINDIHDIHIWEVTSHFICMSIHPVFFKSLKSSCVTMRSST